MLYRCDQTTSLQVDYELLNDVHEQNGGGGEPIAIYEDEEF
jgi:hypothetical protein